MAFQFGFGDDDGDGDGETSPSGEAVRVLDAPTESIRPVREHNLKELVCFKFSLSPYSYELLWFVSDSKLARLSIEAMLYW